MPLTLAQIEALQQDAYADDVEIDFDVMRDWTEAQVSRFFVSGEKPAGTEKPAAVVAEARSEGDDA